MYLLISTKKEIEREEGTQGTSLLEDVHYIATLADLFIGKFHGIWNVLLLATWSTVMFCRAVECRYNAVQCNMILYTALRWLGRICHYQNQCLVIVNWALGTNFGEISIIIRIFSLRKCIWIYRSQNGGKWQCVNRGELSGCCNCRLCFQRERTLSVSLSNGWCCLLLSTRNYKERCRKKSTTSSVCITMTS